MWGKFLEGDSLGDGPNISTCDIAMLPFMNAVIMDIPTAMLDLVCYYSSLVLLYEPQQMGLQDEFAHGVPIRKLFQFLPKL